MPNNANKTQQGTVPGLSLEDVRTLKQEIEGKIAALITDFAQAVRPNDLSIDLEMLVGRDLCSIQPDIYISKVHIKCTL
jgi:hypothetical protein